MKKVLTTFILVVIVSMSTAACIDYTNIPSMNTSINIKKDSSETLTAATCVKTNSCLSNVPKTINIEEKGTIVILATGGTISGIGEAGKTTGYQPGVLSIDDLLYFVPELKEVAPIKAIQICNINSDDITDEIWIKLVNTINEMAKNENIAGFVITHGTDTLEETAYFLNLTVKTDKPVVLTGSMRPATSKSADGPMNLYQAVCTAASDKAIGQGVLVVFSDHIYSARFVTKVSTYDVMAISGGEMGAVGIVRDDSIHMYKKPLKLHTTKTEFNVTNIKKLPKISILYFAVDIDTGLLSYAAEHSKGLVIAGAGAGEYSTKYKKLIEKLTCPIIISSRIDDGIITKDNLLCKNTIAANNLPPQKAAILLRLALTVTSDFDKIEKMFTLY